MKVLHLPEIAHRHIQNAGTKAGQPCHRAVAIYSPLGRLLGWDDCGGLMQRRNGRQRCMKCGRVAERVAA